jgi:thymidine kinase|tara:strand:+ start:16 stop:564 length:549 start_codon:yes stop_codon:yes gene_type:complete
MSITLITGCMFSGKTTLLLSISKKYKDAGKKIMGINFNKNSRYNTQRIITHDKETFNFDTELSVSHLNNIILGEFYSLYKAYDVIVIDELQFYPDGYDFIINCVNKDNKIVICSGLNGDFNKKPFEQITRLIGEADEIYYLKSDCKCGKKASFSKRIVNSSEKILIGSFESYVPTCRECYNK